MNLGDIWVRAQKLTIDNSPAILTGAAVAGTVITAYLTGKASIKASEIIRTEEDTFNLSPSDTKKKVELVWTLYIPPATTGLLTVACIIGANRIGTRRAAALAAAYTLSEKAFDEYRGKIVEKLGAKKEQAARDELAQERVSRNPATTAQMIIVDGKGVLCYESYTGRYFTNDMETLRKAQNDVNHMVNNNYYASLTDFYNLIGIETTTVSDEVGWNADKLLELKFSAVLTSSGKPCICVDYDVTPIRDYNRLA